MPVSAKAVRFDNDSMWVDLSDGRTLGVPFAWFPRLLNATKHEREAVEIGRYGLHWAEIDEDISIAGLLAGQRDQTIKAANPAKTVPSRTERPPSKRRKRARKAASAKPARTAGISPWRLILLSHDFRRFARL